MFNSHHSATVAFFVGLPSHTLEQCVIESGTVTLATLDTLKKELPEDAVLARAQLVGTLIDRHESANELRTLLDAAARHVHLDPIQQLRLDSLLRVLEQPPSIAHPDAAKQAAMVKRDHTLPLDQTCRFLQEISGKICLVVANHPESHAQLGTGVLIGPDLVLTSYHLLKGHIEEDGRALQSETSLIAVFDYHGTLPFDITRPRPPGTVEVPFARDWLVAFSKDMPHDGTFRIPNAQQLTQLQGCLDFAVVRLADEIGLRPRVPLGGPRRLWHDLPRVHDPLLPDQCIIIPQHPQGWPRRISFGRYSATCTGFDTSNTRMRYDCETDKGSSGAPCFNSSFEFIGIHNATFSPGGGIEANQAIRAEPIVDELKDLLGVFKKEAAIPFWNASSDPAKPRPVFGRRQLLRWIEDASSDDELAQRSHCYVAREASGVPQGGSGLSFSAEILLAAKSGAGSEGLS